MYNDILKSRILACYSNTPDLIKGGLHAQHKYIRKEGDKYIYEEPHNEAKEPKLAEKKKKVNKDEKASLTEPKIEKVNSRSDLKFRGKKLKKDEVLGCRVLYVDSIDDLDIKNIGCHFSNSLQYIHTGGGSNGTTNNNKKYMLRVISVFKKDQVNQEATDVSNEGFKHESEIVLKPNENVDVEIEVSKNNGKQGGSTSWMPLFNENYKGTVNTGNRYDKWVEKYV
jgi:hypothetical protein